MKTTDARPLPDWLIERLATTPREPGCYLMRDRSGEIVYVGKALDLRARLGQYFVPNPGDTRFFVGLLERVLGDIELIVARSDKEALLLENELIKRYQPRFNVKLKDDKSFLLIRIARMGPEHPWPRLEVIRQGQARRDGADHFGPYDSATAIRRALRVVNRHFHLRTCRDSELRNRARPCLEHQIGRCPAPCALPVDRATYQESLREVRMFLQGRGVDLARQLRRKMELASDTLAFELAARYRDQIAAIERSLGDQIIRLRQVVDLDALGLYREGGDLAFTLLEVRGGAVTGTRPFVMRDVSGPDADVVEDFLALYYDGTRPLPDAVLTPIGLADAALWGELLTEARGRRVRVHHPQRGDRRRVLELAQDNARQTFKARRERRTDALATLKRLQARLGLRNLPARIECYDISNISGTDAVGSMVVAVDGELAPREYRHFKIGSLETPDDFLMMSEVLGRRFRGGAAGAGRSDGQPAGQADRQPDGHPDMVLVDGGLGQLGIAMAVLADLGLHDIDLAGLAKPRVLDEGGQVRRSARPAPSSEEVERSPERVFRPGRKNPVVLRTNSNELFLLQRLRDEAHRFAITHHRRRRKKRTLGSELGRVRGVGPARQRALLRHFGSLARVRAAGVDELAACPGISRALAERVREALRDGR